MITCRMFGVLNNLTLYVEKCKEFIKNKKKSKMALDFTEVLNLFKAL